MVHLGDVARYSIPRGAFRGDSINVRALEKSTYVRHVIASLRPCRLSRVIRRVQHNLNEFGTLCQRLDLVVQRLECLVRLWLDLLQSCSNSDTKQICTGEVIEHQA